MKQEISAPVMAVIVVIFVVVVGALGWFLINRQSGGGKADITAPAGTVRSGGSTTGGGQAVVPLEPKT